MDSSDPNPVMARLRLLVEPAPPRPPAKEAAARLRLTLEMANAGIEMMRLNLARRHPEATPDGIDAMLGDWLRRRPGAEHGDSWGRPAPDRLAGL